MLSGKHPAGQTKENPLEKMFLKWALPGSLLLLLAGCAGNAEWSAFEKWEEDLLSSRPASSYSHSVASFPDLKNSSDLTDLLAFAALNNPELAAAFHEWKAELEKISQARSLPDPRFTYGYYIREVETRVGPQRQSFTLSQTFPWYGKLAARHDAALESTEAARMRYEAVKLRLFYRVKHAWYEYAYLARVIAVTRENIHLLTNLETVVRTKFKTGTASHPAIIRIQIEMGKQEDRLKSLVDYRRPLLATLNETLGRSSDAPVADPTSMPEQVVVIEEAALSARLSRKNPELASLDASVRRERANVEVAGQSWVPDVTLGVSYVDTDEALMGGTRDSGKDPVIASLSVNLPLWHETYRAAERSAHAKEHAARSRREAKEDRLALDLTKALFHFRDAERKIDLFRDTLIPKTEQSLAAVQQAFSAGKGDYLDLIDAERILLEFRLSFERARTDRAQRIAELEMLVGEEFPVQAAPGREGEEK